LDQFIKWGWQLEILALPKGVFSAHEAISTASDNLAPYATSMTLPAGLGEGDRHTHHGGEVKESLRLEIGKSAYTIEGQKKGGSSSTLL